MPPPRPPVGQEPNAGAIAGAASWAGTEHERGVAAFIAVHVLAGEPLRILGLPDAVPIDLRLQADEPVDDIVCALPGGGEAFFQARRTLNWNNSPATGFRWVASQWERLARQRQLDPSHDRLVAVCERPSEAIDTLELQLRRRRTRRRGRDTAGQRKAISRLEQSLSGLSAADRRRVLACAAVWRLSVVNRDDVAVELCWQLLGSRVTAPEHAQAAWDRLAAACGEAARLRQGLDADELRDLLRAADIPLREDLPGSAGARRAAAARHRHRLVRDGMSLTFAGLAATIPPIQLDAADAEVRVVEHTPDKDPDREFGHALWWVLRRRGRLLLTGLPGAGKSTAVRRTAAEYAGRRDWPLPLLVRVDRVADLLGGRSVRDAVLDVATEDASAADRADLRTVFEHAFDDGTAAVMCDGLDETGDARHPALRALRRFIEDVHDDVELLLATRDVAYADAHTLELADARLLPPAEPLAPVGPVLQALAGDRRGGERERWIERRRDWVAAAVAADPTLAETPLVPVLLAQLAAGRDEAALPAERALIMSDAVDAVIRRWEAAKPDDRAALGALRGRRAHAALLVAFKTIGRRLVEQQLPSRATVVAAVSTELCEAFTLTRVEGDVAAAEAVTFWDAAGFFVATGPDELVVARVRLFAEVADALLATESPAAAQRAWAEAAVSDELRREPLALASALSPTIADAALIEAAANGTSEVLLRAYRLPGTGRASTGARRQLAAALASAAANADPLRWEAAVAAVRVTDANPAPIDAVIAAWPARGQQIALRALRIMSLGCRDPQSDAYLEEALRLEGLENEPPLGSGPLAFFFAEDILSEVVVHAAEALVPDRPELADVASAHLGSRAGGSRLRDVLRRAGRDDLVEAADRREEQQLDELTAAGSIWDQMPDFYGADLTALGWIAAVAEPATLTRAQRRRLDALADLWATLRLPFPRSLEPAQVIERHPETASRVIVAVARLLPTATARLASEARQLLAESEQAPETAHQLLSVAGVRRPIDGWTSLSDTREAIQTLIDALGIGHWLSHVSFDALLAAPLNHADLGPIDNVARNARRAHNRRWATCLRAAKTPSNDFDAYAQRTLTDGDPAARGGLGWFVAAKGNHEGVYDAAIVRALLDDPDDEVRRGFLEDLKGERLPDEILQAVRAADWAPRPWRCPQCETYNSAGSRSCAKCNQVPGMAASSASALLSAAAEHPPPGSQRPLNDRHLT